MRDWTMPNAKLKYELQIIKVKGIFNEQQQ